MSEHVIGACIEVHRRLGPGLLESAYEECVCHELALRGVPFLRQQALSIDYKGHLVDGAYRLDLVVADAVIVELKAVDQLLPLHAAQWLTYVRLSGLAAGLLVNFNVPLLRHGLRRVTR